MGHGKTGGGSAGPVGRDGAVRMKTAHLSWEEVTERAAGQVIEVTYDGISARGNCGEDFMIRRFSGCELVQLTKTDYMVTKWPEERR